MLTVVATVVIKQRGFEIGIVPCMVIFLLSLFGVVLPVVFKRWYYVRRRLKNNPITAEYVPPLGFSPAEISFLFNNRLQPRAIGATIINLTHRGLLTAKKTGNSKHFFAGPRVDNNLKTYENMIVQSADVEGGISGNDLVNGAIFFGANKGTGRGISNTASMEQSIKKDLTHLGFIRDSYIRQITYRTLKLAVFLVVSLIWLPFMVAIIISIIKNGSSTFADVEFLFIFSLIVSVIALVPMILVSSIINIVRGRITGREWAITPKLGRFWLQVVGFRQYVQLAELDKLNYRTEKMKKMSKNDVLPYSVALGFVKNWRDIIS